MTWPEIEPRSHQPLANTLTTRPMDDHNKVSKFGYRSRGRLESFFFFISYYTEVLGGASLFLGLLHFTFHTCIILLSVKQGGIKCHFLNSMTRSGIELLTRTMSQSTIIIISNKYFILVFFRLLLQISFRLFLQISSSQLSWMFRILKYYLLQKTL